MWLKRQYTDAFGYLKRKWLCCLIVLVVIIELLVFALLNTAADGHYEQYLAETVGQYSGKFAFIFLENLQSMLIMILMGTIPAFLGIFFVSNQTISGLVATGKWILPDVGVTRLLISILPHGIFEIPAICFTILLSALWSRTVTIAIIRLIRRKPVITSFREDVAGILKSIVFILLPLVLIAAVIEATLTRWIVGMLP